MQDSKTTYTGINGIVARNNDDMSRITNTKCPHCGAELEIPLKAFDHRVDLVLATTRDELDLCERNGAEAPKEAVDRYFVQCPVPYCRNEVLVEDLPQWMLRVIKSGYLKRPTPEYP
jgi:hypothetical protein